MDAGTWDWDWDWDELKSEPLNDHSWWLCQGLHIIMGFGEVLVSVTLSMDRYHVFEKDEKLSYLIRAI